MNETSKTQNFSERTIRCSNLIALLMKFKYATTKMKSNFSVPFSKWILLQKLFIFFSFCNSIEGTIALPNSRYKELLRNSADLKKNIEKIEKLKADLHKKGAEIKKLRKLKNRQIGQVREKQFFFSFETLQHENWEINI